jgi:hypothetical protein
MQLEGSNTFADEFFLVSAVADLAALLPVLPAAALCCLL